MERVVDPTGVMASTSSVGVAPHSSPNAPAMSPNNGSSAGDMTPAPINPLLLASMCFGSSAALDFLFSREDNQEPPMVMPTQAFLDLLVGYTTDCSSRRRLTMPQASDVENGVHQPVLPVAAFHEKEDVDHTLPAMGSHNIEDGADRPASPAVAGHDTEDGADQPASPAVAAHDTEDGADQPALAVTAPDDIEDGVDQPEFPGATSDEIEEVDQPTLPPASKLLKGVTAEGDTALHVVASHGDSAEFVKCARIINTRDQDLLLAVNKKDDTALHCAARAGNSKMVSCLIKLAGNRNKLQDLVRKENGLKETALHDAVLIGRNDIVESLLEADRDLANYPKEGTSPLYLAISLAKYAIASTLHDESNGNLSYSGPNGQNALHAAIFQGSAITKDMLSWNNSLTTHGDTDGSTPLHFASGFWRSNGFRQLLEANPAPVYQADNNGLFPIHVAASVGRNETISIILEKFPTSAVLRTAQGQTFLHIAVEKRRINIVSSVCQTPSLAWILNMRDNNGNTALHLAVQARKLRIFCSLCANNQVQLSIANNSKQTPRDISISLLPRGVYYTWNSDNLIHNALKLLGAEHSCVRRDQFEEKYRYQLRPEETIKAAENVKDLSQMIGICSVLIATVAFGATFAVPGGFIADEHTNRGTPTLAGRYTFDAFMVANALAFICASIVTIGLMFSGSSMHNLVSRSMHLSASWFFMSSSVTSLSAAFALGVYMVLAPVAHATAIVICVLSPLVVLYRNFEFLLKFGILARPLCQRMGRVRALKWLTMMIIWLLLTELWPFILIFGWAAIAQKIRNHL